MARCSSRRWRRPGGRHRARRRSRSAARRDRCGCHRGTETDPGARLWKFGQQPHEGLSFEQAGQGFASENVRSGGQQRRQSRPVEFDQRRFVETIVTTIFGTVGQNGAVGTDRGGDEWARATYDDGVRPERVAGLASQTPNAGSAPALRMEQRPRRVKPSTLA